MKNIDVLCIGVTSYDLVFTIDHHPRADEKSLANSFLSCGGGPAANAAVTVARLGLTAAFCGYLGTDIFGQLHFDELSAAHVDTQLVIRGNEQAPVSTVLVKPNGNRSLINYRSSKPLKKDTIDPGKINPKVILFDGHEPDISMRFLEIAGNRAIPTILDAGSVNKGTQMLYDKVDYLVCSEIFASELTKEREPEKALEKLSDHNKNIVITLGKKGLLWKTQNDRNAMPAFPVQAIDTTGAGDVFHGAFAGCIALKKDWIYTLKFSSAAAAVSCTRLGARTSIPTKEQVEAFLKNNPEI